MVNILYLIFNIFFFVGKVVHLTATEHSFTIFATCQSEMKRKIITQNRSEGKTEIIPVLVSTLSFLSLTHALFNSYGKKKISPNSIPLSIRIAITVESPSPISNSQSSNPNIHRFFHLPIRYMLIFDHSTFFFRSIECN